MGNYGILTKRHLIRNILKSWERQYPSELEPGMSSPKLPNGKSKRETYEELNKLNLEVVSADVIDFIIGNSSWTELKCSVCNNDSEKVIVIDTYDDTVYICFKCIREIYIEILKEKHDNKA